MKETVRLYRPHDMDLMVMYLSEGYKLGSELKKCLIAFAKGEVYIPSEFVFDPNGATAKRFDIKDAKNGKYVKTRYSIPIILNPNKEDEAAAINVLKQVRKGYRCSFIKMLFRNNIITLPLMACINDNGIITKKETFDDVYKKETLKSTTINRKEELSLKEEEADTELKEIEDDSDPLSFLDDLMTGM